MLVFGIEQFSLLDAINAVGKISIVLGMVIALQFVVRFGSADKRALAVRISLLYLCLAPFAILQNWNIVPQLKLQAPLALSALSDGALDIPSLPQLAYSAGKLHSTAESISSFTLLLTLYTLVALFLVLRIAVSIAQLLRSQDWLPHSMDAKLDLARHYLWTDRLQQLQSQYGIRRPIQLAISERISSPISWGIWHHTIVIDLNSFHQHEPDDILRHELAHIVHHDWISVIVMRLICAVYWFHPMIWLLQRQFRYQLECAADNTVLRMGGRASDYAQTLIEVSRADTMQKNLAMHLAAKGSSLYQRILNILSTEQARTPVTKRDWTIGIVLSMLILLGSASFSLVGEQVQWPQQLFESSLSHSPAPQQVAEEVAQQLEALDNDNFVALARAIRHRSFDERHAKGSTSFKQRSAIPILILALHDEDPVVRRLALWGLSEMRFFETLPVIAILLKDKDPQVRAEAVGAIGDFGEKPWAQKIAPLLSDPSPIVRQRVAHALGDLANVQTLAVLKQALSQADNQAYPQVLSEIQWAIHELEE